jgi:hypothetical protein
MSHYLIACTDIYSFSGKLYIAQAKRKRKEGSRTIGMGDIRKASNLIFIPPTLEVITKELRFPPCSHS